MSNLHSSPLHTNSPATAAPPAPHDAMRRSRNRRLAGLLLAATVSTLVVLADNLLEGYAENDLLTVWLVSWAVAFAALALFADAARKAAAWMLRRGAAATARRARQRSDAYLRSLAAHDHRIMAELLAAQGRAEQEDLAPTTDAARSALLASAAGALSSWTARRLRQQQDAALWVAAQHDPRVRAEVQAAMERARHEQAAQDEARGRHWLARHPAGTFNAAYQGPRGGFRTSPLAGLPTHVQYLPG